MAVYFQLTHKGEKYPDSLQLVDDKMRESFGAEPSTTKWFENWYDTIGFALAIGRDFNYCRETWPEKNSVIDWIETHYKVDRGACR